MSAFYWEALGGELGARMRVEFSTVGRDVLDYSVVLLLPVGDHLETIRVYDGTHGMNELHRYTKSDGKRVAVVFHRGTLGAGMRAAVDQVKSNHVSMVEGWEER